MNLHKQKKVSLEFKAGLKSKGLYQSLVVIWYNYTDLARPIN